MGFLGFLRDAFFPKPKWKEDEIPEVETGAVEDCIDLHTFQPRDVPSLVHEYLAAAQEQGLEEVRIIHGKGKGVQRAVVRRLLANHPAVRSFVDAPAERGGWGAQLVQLSIRGRSRRHE